MYIYIEQIKKSLKENHKTMLTIYFLLTSLFTLISIDPSLKTKQAPEILYIPTVTYPARANRWNLEGKVFIEFYIQTDGTTRSHRILSADYNLFIPPADSIAKGMRFEPISKPVKYILPVIFKLKK